MNIHDPLYAAAHPEPLTQVTLYSAPLIIPVTGPVILNGAIAVSGSRVVHVGTRRWVWDTLESELAAGARVEERHWHGVITPGLVNAHTHLQYTVMAEVGRGTYGGFHDWERAFDDVYDGLDGNVWRDSARAGARMMVQAGTTAAADIVTDPEAADALASQGMHGVAFDAQLWVGEFQLNMEDDRVERFFALHPEVRIYSNSWVRGDILLFSPGELEQEASDQEEFESDPLILQEVAEPCLEHALSNPDTVFAFGAGNDGMIGSNRLPAALPRYVGNGRLSNWLSISAVNSHAITRDEEGHLIVPSSALPSFTNLARGSELSTVMAPGYNLWAPYSRGDRWYCTSSGTSMATPLVSGTLALVAQAYPWMTGKQLADAVLTTASNDFVAPDAAVLYGSQENGSEGRVRLVLIDRDELVVDGTARTFEELQKDPNLAAQACLEILSRDPDTYFQEEVEEFLADKFMMFALEMQESGKARATEYRGLLGFFKRMWDWVTRQIGFRPSYQDINTLFKRIYDGQYSRVRTNKESLVYFDNVYGKDAKVPLVINGVTLNMDSRTLDRIVTNLTA